MTRYIFALFAALSVLLAACPGPDDSGNPDDTGSEGFGDILATLEVDGVDVDVVVTATNPNRSTEVYSGTTGIPLEVPVGTWIVTFGDSPNTNDGLPTVELDNLSWVAPPITLDVTADLESAADGKANRYLHGNYACEYDSYGYDAGAPDKKGVYIGTYDLDRQVFTVVEGYLLEPQSDPRMGGVVDDGNLSIDVDHLNLLGASADYVTASTIDVNENFSFTLVNPDSFAAVYDIRCEL